MCVKHYNFCCWPKPKNQKVLIPHQNNKEHTKRVSLSVGVGSSLRRARVRLCRPSWEGYVETNSSQNWRSSLRRRAQKNTNLTSLNITLFLHAVLAASWLEVSYGLQIGPLLPFFCLPLVCFAFFSQISFVCFFLFLFSLSLELGQLGFRSWGQMCWSWAHLLICPHLLFINFICVAPLFLFSLFLYFMFLTVSLATYLFPTYKTQS